MSQSAAATLVTADDKNAVYKRIRYPLRCSAPVPVPVPRLAVWRCV